MCFQCFFSSSTSLSSSFSPITINIICHIALCRITHAACNIPRSNFALFSWLLKLIKGTCEIDHNAKRTRWLSMLMSDTSPTCYQYWVCVHGCRADDNNETMWTWHNNSNNSKMVVIEGRRTKNLNDDDERARKQARKSKRKENERKLRKNIGFALCYHYVMHLQRQQNIVRKCIQ